MPFKIRFLGHESIRFLSKQKVKREKGKGLIRSFLIVVFDFLEVGFFNFIKTTVAAFILRLLTISVLLLLLLNIPESLVKKAGIALLFAS